MLLDHDEPTNYEEAMMSPDSAKWFEGHEIWDGIHVLEQRMDFGGLARWSASHWDKWILKKKTDVDGNVTVYEARLVAKSFSQVQGVDYDEIFSSVAMLKSVGFMLALAAFMKSGRWMSKQVSLPVFVRKGCMWYNQKGFVDPKMLKGMLAPAILLRTGVSISELECMLWWWSKILGLYKVYEKLVFPKKWVGAL